MHPIDRTIDLPPRRAIVARASNVLTRLVLGAAVLFILQITFGLVHG